MALLSWENIRDLCEEVAGKLAVRVSLSEGLSFSGAVNQGTPGASAWPVRPTDSGAIPILLTAPNDGALAAELAARNLPTNAARGYQALDAATVTTSDGTASVSFAHLAGQGYAWPFTSIQSTGRVLVFL